MFNVIRSLDAPETLSEMTRYDSEDVYEKLTNDFHNKCYICETPEPHDVNVEHFVSHRNNNEHLKFNWKNLYLSCSRCNNIKGQAFDNLLDCCDPNIDVYKSLKLLPPRSPSGLSVQIEKRVELPGIDETVELLNRVYNSDRTINKQVSADYLRRKIFERLNKLYVYILKWYSDESLAHEKADSLERIKLFLQSSAPYSAFMRDVISEDKKLKYLLDELTD